MKLQYLGTAAAEGVPGIFCKCDTCRHARKVGGKEFRARCGAIVNDTLMIDFPPDAFTTCMRFGIDLSDVTDIIFTHEHGDHLCPGDLALRTEPVLCYREDHTKLRVYGNEHVFYRIRKEHLWENGGKECIELTELKPFEPRKIDGVTVTPLPAINVQDALFYLLEQDGKRILYAHDTDIFPDEVFDFLAGKKLDLVSLDSNCAGKAVSCRGHMNMKDNAVVKQRLTDLGCAKEDTVWVISHFSHNGLRHADGSALTYEGLEADANRLGMTASYDGLIFEI